MPLAGSESSSRLDGGDGRYSPNTQLEVHSLPIQIILAKKTKRKWQNVVMMVNDILNNGGRGNGP